MAKYVMTFVSLLGLGVNAATKVELQYPSTVRVGEEFILQVQAESPGGKDIVYEFNGETRFAPADLRHYLAAEHKSADAIQLEDGTISSKSKYQGLCTVPFPQDQGLTAVWLRYRGGPLCVRNSEKEFKWCWQAPKQLQWIYAGSYDSEQMGSNLTVMGYSKEPYAQLAAIMLTSATPNRFIPAAELPHIFKWRAVRSAIGQHELSLRVDGVEYPVTFAVLDNEDNEAKAAAAPPLLIPAERQRSLVTAALHQDPAQYPLFNFFNEHYRGILSAHPYGLSFQDNFMLPLHCNDYPQLANSVQMAVNAKLPGLAFLLTEYWQGEVAQEMAHFMVHYEDGETVRIPLREEIEVCGSLRNHNPQAALFIGTVHSRSIEYHLTIVPWLNPRPDSVIRTLDFSNVRMVFSEEENKTIPLNVTGMSSQILLDVLGLSDATDAAALAALAASPEAGHAPDADVCIDYKRIAGPIHPSVFSTNESNVMSVNGLDYDRYLEKMKEINCRNFRFHSGWNLEKVYPQQLENPNYEPFLRSIRQLQACSSEWDIMVCFNRIPKYVDPKTPAGRSLFASLCADLVREVNITQGLNVRYWEIYNEVYFTKIAEDRALWLMYNEAAAAIRQADPDCRIGGYAPCWPVISNLRDFYSHCHAETDFVSYHKYLTGSASTATDYIMQKTASFGEDARQIRAMIESITPGKPVELALTEYNINFNWKPHDPRQGNHVGAAWLASVLYHLIRADVEIAQTWHSRGGGTFGLISNNGDVRPMGKLLAVCNNHISGDYVWSASSSVGIECLGFRNEQNAGFLMVNKTAQPTRVSISLLNPPSFQTSFIVPAAQSFAITDAGFNVSRAALPRELILAPYETRVIVNPLQRNP